MKMQMHNDALNIEVKMQLKQKTFFWCNWETFCPLDQQIEEGWRD